MIQAFSSIINNFDVLFSIFFMVFIEILESNVIPRTRRYSTKIKKRDIGSSILIGVIIFIIITAFFYLNGSNITLSSNWAFYPGIVSSIFILIYLISIVGANVIHRSPRHGPKIMKEDKGSALLIILSTFISIIVVFSFAGYNIALLPSWAFYLGIISMILGIIIRQLSIAFLGRFFSPTINIQKDQEVVDNGPYKLIRHPSYTGGLLILIGLGLALQSWGAVLITLLILSLAYGYRIHVEEKLLVTELGDEYIDYMKRTKRLIPYIL
ncbi:MAG: isoprenylcysteine carboxylmethyltransferase family protein [Methanobacterium sp.]|jgi:protein-S-isoprenylcysteine O-methyltransferase Ste14